MENITREAVQKVLEYDPETGAFTWLSNRIKALTGKPLSSVNCYGYLRLKLFGKEYVAHRIAFLLVLGRMPVDQVDHINGDRMDNRWVNLREVSNAENCRNRKVRSDNNSGYMGVSWESGRNKWKAGICFDGQRRHLGYFDTLELAIDARRAAESASGFHPNNGRR